MKKNYNIITRLMKKSFLFCSFILLITCSTDKTLLSENSITLIQLQINGEIIDGQINQSTNLITFNVIDADLTLLKPNITISEGAIINPSPNLPRNFNEEVRYTVTAQNGSDKEYVVTVNNTIRSGENLIDLFQLNIKNEMVNGQINQENNTIIFDLVDADLSSLTPIIEISERATITPNTAVSQSFNETINYTVTAENGNERKYEVIVNNRPFSTGKDILSFTVGINGESVEARLDQDLKEISFETGSFDISRLVPEIVIDENATISPASGEPVDFTNPVTYTVTAENGDVVQYTVGINQAFNINAFTLVGPRYGAQLLFVRAEMFIDLDFLDPSVPGARLYLDDGVNTIDLPILNLETYEWQRVITNRVTTKIPDNTVTSTNYKIVYEAGDTSLESSFLIDVLAEGAPRIVSTNQNSYKEGDTLIVTGENLTDVIGVPSNGSFYILDSRGNIDVELNTERTEYKLLLDGSTIRPAFFPFDAVTRDIIFMTLERRLGEQITINIE